MGQLEIAMDESTYKIHSSDFRRGCLEQGSGVRVRYTCNYDITVVHDKPKDLIESTFSKLAYRNASLRTSTFGCNLHKLRHVEAFVALAKLGFLIP